MTGKLPWRRTMWGSPGLASCLEVGRALQSYLDGRVDDLTAARVARHLELCRRCGMKAETYLQIKTSLASRGEQVDQDAVERLRSFGRELLERGDGPDEGGSGASSG